MLLLSLLLAIHTHALTLDEAFRSALQKNEAAQQSQEQVKQAEEQVRQAKGAILPSVFFNATHQIQARPKDPLARAISPEKQTTANFTLSQPVFRGFREFAGKREREDLLTAEQERRAASLIQLYQNVAGSYLNVLTLEQDLKNLAQQRDLYADRVKELRARIRRGESRSTEALTAQSTEASLEAEIRLTESQLKTAREAFSLATGLPADSSLTEEARDLKVKPLAEYLARVEERPDVKEARARVEAAEEDVSVARGAHWPSIDAIGNYYVKRPEGVLEDIDWDVQFRLTFPIFEGGLRVSETRVASSRLRESELELQRLRRAAEADIRSLYESTRLRADQLDALRRSTELAQKNYEVLQREERRGLSRNIDVQLALTEYRSARRSYDQTRFASQLDLIRLETAATFLPAALKEQL